MNNTAARGNDLFINNDLDNNLILSTVDLVSNDFDQSSAGFYIHRSIPIDSSNLDNADPRFVNQANGDYHLRRSSPCIDFTAYRRSLLTFPISDAEFRDIACAPSTAKTLC